MRERPILFNGDMVRAILEGRKTVTRRLVDPQPPVGHQWHGWIVESSNRKDEGKASWAACEGSLAHDAHRVHCPFGRPGDRLWVRETFVGGQNGTAIRYRATEPDWPAGQGTHWPWRPSIHMPRWASRILLEVTAVRVERLQDITEEQAQAEGADPIHLDGLTASDITALDLEWADPATPYRNGFRRLWESLGGDWDANPWVWVIEFKRAEVRHA